MKKQPVIVVVGPTASGKTAVAVEIAKKYNGEVVSADSMQIYKGISVATAKPTAAEMQGIKHYLIDFVDPCQSFSVADYVAEAKKAVAEIVSKGKIPIICGGTGLYINSLIDNVKFDDTCADTELRGKLYEFAKLNGNHCLWERLNEIDPETAKNVHENNLSRVVRAIEVYEKTGIPLSRHKINSRMEESPYEPLMIGLTYNDRQKLYDRINIRVDKMLESGLVEEARKVYDTYGLKTAHQAIGYKELIPYFESRSDLESCIENIKQETRRYAKRQLTWFRRDIRINWIEIEESVNSQKIIEKIEKIIAKSKILCYNKS